MNAQELQKTGWYLDDLGRQDLLRHIGAAIWMEWSSEIRVEKHPARAALLAFLRCWAAPAGDWLPPGMADYLADRLDKGVSTPDRGGRPTEPISVKLDEHALQVHIAALVLEAWTRHRKTKTPYPQRAAFKTVADALDLREVDVRLVFFRHRKTAEARAKVAQGTAINSLSNEDLAAFVSGPKSVSDLIIKALTPSELARIRHGESLDSVLQTPDTDPSERPYPFLNTPPPAAGT